ncbi:prolyl oligopeptidase family serine peptidase [Plantactinospora sp. ZYX-F-223]|uniref:alpha/beta hydrolase family protein n=1 Tax=Plantactinospora sp. ZYX-F-223 TaxID=3144103 RepID=UPI0031FD46EA
MDPDLAGLAVDRAWPTVIEIHAHHTSPGWILPLTDVLPAQLAWHPERPLVAGLVVRDRRAHPWVADYATQTVTVFDQVRAATSHAWPPQVWVDDRLVLLLPSPPPAKTPPAHGNPVALEATGPMYVKFLPSLPELAALIAAQPAALDPATGQAIGLTHPLVVRRLADLDGELYLEYAEDDPASEDGLSWSSLTVSVDGSGPPRPVPEAPHEPAPWEATPAPEPTHPTGISIETGYHQARLTQHPGKPATVLWLRNARPGDRVTEPPLLDTGHAVAHLDLPLHWPADATVESLHPQIVETVRAAMAIVDGPMLVGGHSFSATLALYALAHVPELRAAIVHSGCYNRTLTPTGWQHEKRHLWQAPDIYRAFSALEFADKLDRPVLLAHGTNDTNPATAPEQSVELYKAIVANGGTARLLLLPGAGHTFYYAEHTAFLSTEHRNWIERWTR